MQFQAIACLLPIEILHQMMIQLIPPFFTVISQTKIVIYSNLQHNRCKQNTKEQNRHPQSLQKLLLLLTISMRSSQPSLVRVCVAQDGRLKAQFNDNSLLLLSASGRTFIHCNSDDGSRVQQLSDFAVSRYTGKLSQVR